VVADQTENVDNRVSRLSKSKWEKELSKSTTVERRVKHSRKRCEYQRENQEFANKRAEEYAGKVKRRKKGQRVSEPVVNTSPTNDRSFTFKVFSLDGGVREILPEIRDRRITAAKGSASDLKILKSCQVNQGRGSSGSDLSGTEMKKR
jgi:hypothetical protein